MNIEQAKAITIPEILEKLNCRPTREDETDAYYVAPWRDEKTASLHINKKDNLWYDHGIAKGGNSFDMVSHWLKSTGEDNTPVDILRWFRMMRFDNASFEKPKTKASKVSAWKLLREKPVEDLALIRYLENRGIDFWLAEKYICEVFIKSVKTNTKLYAIGFKNENGGYELRNPFLKSCISPKTITFIRGSTIKPLGVHIFEGFMDYLTFLTIENGEHTEDVIVLNSTNCINDALPYIKNYGYTHTYTWMDNDKTGTQTTKVFSDFFKKENITHVKKNDEYAAYKDLNSSHVHRLTMN